MPLVMSSGVWSIQHFVNRMFLSWYSPMAVAASMPAGILHWTILSIFCGTAGYASTFVAQYHGAGVPRKIGPSVWQGVYVAVLAGLIMAALVPLTGRIFAWIGHEAAVQADEVVYFRILCVSAAPATASAALSCFFAGRGKTWPVLWVNCVAIAVNVLLDYVFIFGKIGSPVMGIRGAGWATVLSNSLSTVLFFALLCRPCDRRKFRTLDAAFRPDLFLRLMRFGIPNGIYMLLDVIGWTVFVLLIGRYGTAQLAATNITFNINSLAFMPMFGLGSAILVLVGQNQGKLNPEMASKCTMSGFHLGFAYMALIGLAYFFAPWVFLKPFTFRNPGYFLEIERSVTVFLRFVAFYSLFDVLTIVFAHAIRGAGDTRFAMKTTVVLSFGLLIVPSVLVIVVWKLHPYFAWVVATGYLCVLGLTFLWRFRKGHWKSMRVIEEAPVIILSGETPGVA